MSTKKRYFFRQALFLVLILLSISSLTACGTGSATPNGDDGKPTGDQDPLFTVTGTVAVGAPLSNAQVTIIDQIAAAVSLPAGSRRGQTNAQGKFTIDTTGLTPPFILEAKTSGKTLYSISSDSKPKTTINATPFTDIITRTAFKLKGTTVENALQDIASAPVLSSTLVDSVQKVVFRTTQLWMDKVNINSVDDFNFISTPFDADGTGIDKVLDQTVIDPLSGKITISDDVTTQVSEIDTSSTDGSVEIMTTTEGPNGITSSNTFTSLLPVQPEQETALDEIGDSLQQIADLINTKGTDLSVPDVLPFLDPDLLNDGIHQTEFAINMVEELAGVSLLFTVKEIQKLDLDQNLAHVVFDVSETKDGQTQTETIDFFFKKINGSWLLSGNQQVASVSLHAEMRTNQGVFGSSEDGPSINVDVQAPQGSVTSVMVTGGNGLWDHHLFQQGATVEGLVLLDHFFLNSGPLGQILAAGTPFAVELQTIDGSQNYDFKSNAFTNEAIHITSPTDSTLSDKIGVPLTVSWTLPTTFPIGNVQLSALTFTGDQNSPSTLQCEVNGPILGTAATSAVITIPTTCGSNNLPVQKVNINLGVDGVNGERDQVIYGLE